MTETTVSQTEETLQESVKKVREDMRGTASALDIIEQFAHEKEFETDRAINLITAMINEQSRHIRERADELFLDLGVEEPGKEVDETPGAESPGAPESADSIKVFELGVVSRRLFMGLYHACENLKRKIAFFASAGLSGDDETEAINGLYYVEQELGVWQKELDEIWEMAKQEKADAGGNDVGTVATAPKAIEDEGPEALRAELDRIKGIMGAMRQVLGDAVESEAPQATI